MGNGSVANVYGLTAAQALILAVILNPDTCIDRHGDLSRIHIAQFLGLKFEEVQNAFDDNLINAIYAASTYHLRLHRARVDSALIKSASLPSSFGFSDRKLYYQLIGDLRKEGRPAELPGMKGLSREQKIESIVRTVERLKSGIAKELFNADQRNSPESGGRPSAQSTEATVS
jgi:hypothetical protein